MLHKFFSVCRQKALIFYVVAAPKNKSIKKPVKHIDKKLKIVIINYLDKF